MSKTRTSVRVSVYQPSLPSPDPVVTPNKSCQESPTTSQSPFNNLKIQEFEIRLRKDTQRSQKTPNIYYTGETLHGSVHLSTLKSLKAVGLVLQVISIEKLGLFSNDVIHTEQVLFGVAKGTDHVKLKGDNTFDFSFDLPTSLLPSVDCNSYFVKYQVKAQIVRIFSKNTISIERDFTVYQDNPNAPDMIACRQEPIDGEIDNGKVKVNYQLNRQGFLLGQAPVVVGEIRNFGTSSATVKVGMTLSRMVKVTLAFDLAVTKIAKKEEQTTDGNGQWSQPIKIPSQQSIPFSLKLDMGAIPPTTHCQNIEIKHLLMLKVHKEKSRFGLSDKLKSATHEIVVGKASQGSIHRSTSSKISLGRNSLKRVAHSRASQGPANHDLPPPYQAISQRKN